MAGAERMRTVGAWTGQDVDAGAVQAQLTKLWRTAVERSHRSGEPAAARTNILTLVTYAATDAAMGHASDCLASLPAHQPSRAILVRAEPDAVVASLAADVLTRCRIDRPQVCQEQIVLYARGAIVEQVSSAVASLLLRDLPAYLWWPSDVRDQPELLSRLVQLCDGVIVDGATFADPAASLATVLAIAGQQPASPLADLAWARLRPWREVTAQFFDASATRPYLNGIAEVAVETASGREITPWSGVLYAGWLATRLGWRTGDAPSLGHDGARLSMSAHDGERPVAITIDASATPGQPISGLAAVRLQGTIGGRAATFAGTAQADDQGSTRSEIAGLAPTEGAFRRTGSDDPALLAHMLGYFRRDRVYEQTLRWLAGSYAAQSTMAAGGQ